VRSSLVSSICVCLPMTHSITSQAQKRKIFSNEAIRGNVRVVVLNACYTHHQALAISEVVDCVIGMPNSIRDTLAIAFAASFYRALGFGHSVQDAFKQGRAAIFLEGGSESDVPLLLTKPGIYPQHLYLYSLNASEIEHSFVLAVEPIFREHKKKST